MPALRRIAHDAAAILVGQLATIGFGVADTVMAGRYASVDLAALSVGIALYVSLYIGASGIVQALIPIVGHHRGAGEDLQVGEAFRQTVWLALAVSLPGLLLMRWPDLLLGLTGAPPEVLARARDYLGWQAWGLPLALLFRCYTGLNQGISKPLLVTLLQLGALALKLPLNRWFIFGGAGLPPQGVAGCAMATLAINAALVLVAAAMLLRHPIYRPFRLWQGWHGPRWSVQKELLRLGLPSGASYFVEVTAFTLMAVFIARLGTTAVAGHQIVSNLASVLYMLPLSIAIATGAQVSQLRGAGRIEEARHAGWQGIGLAVCLSVALGGLVYLLRGAVVALYSTDPAVQAVASGLIVYIALYQLGDATQVTAAFALRSFRVAMLPAAVYVVALWGFGLGGGYALGFNVGGQVPPALQGPAGFWFANAAALALVALVLVLLWRSLARRGLQRPGRD
ncbi:MATE family efflux transporter [Aquabacterium sp. A7-Y]|uniref:MATE family efflux transporter n=1 Tax=Aquabacterium sp. A7-Y TaxID=1349605 RepID=UPI00223CAF6F|nr:MATE family efflux transporter [Aquabacterium sp. A7-Y]MCW7540796.1 MATE family efflux transporter [Aquabacterium sp. A7-Y]